MFEYLSPIKFYLEQEKKNDYKPEPGQPFDKEACRKHLDSIRRHFTKKWREFFVMYIKEAESVNETGYLLTHVRNEADHLNILNHLHEYIGDFLSGNKRQMRSYFELYHFVMQKRMLTELSPQEIPECNIPEQWRKPVEMYGEPCLDWIKVAYVSLAYNLARYKSLTVEALFDKDSEDGKAREEQLKGK